MVASCSAYGCSNRYGQPGKRFFSFPKDKIRKDRWIAAIKRQNWTPSVHSKVCSDHFKSGKPCSGPLHPDYVPTLFCFSAAKPISKSYLRAVNRARRSNKSPRNGAIYCNGAMSCNAAKERNVDKPKGGRFQRKVGGYANDEDEERDSNYKGNGRCNQDRAENCNEENQEWNNQDADKARYDSQEKGGNNKGECSNRDDKGGDWGNRDDEGGDRSSQDDEGGDWGNRDDEGGDWGNRNDEDGDRSSQDDEGGDRRSQDDEGGDWGNRDWGNRDDEDGDRSSQDDEGGDRRSQDDEGGDWGNRDWGNRDDEDGDRSNQDDEGGDRRSQDDEGGDWGNRDWGNRNDEDGDRSSQDDEGGDRRSQDDEGGDWGNRDWGNRDDKDGDRSSQDDEGSDCGNQDDEGEDWGNQDDKGGDQSSQDDEGGDWGNRDDEEGVWGNRDNEGENRSNRDDEGRDWGNQDDEGGDWGNRDDEGCDNLTFDYLMKQLELKEVEIGELQIENEELVLTNSTLQQENSMLKHKLYMVEQENWFLKQQIAMLSNQEPSPPKKPEPVGKLTSDFIKGDNGKVCFYTGLQKYADFENLLKLLQPLLSKVEGRSKCSLADELLMVLMKLRLALQNEDLGYRFAISPTMVSTIFHKWINVMSVELKCLVHWPDPIILRENLPQSFRKHYSKVKCIIDCFEIFIERPISFEARAVTYSNYKKHNTVKVLIGVSPTGAICFISKAWGGRVSDKEITQKCGFLDFVDYGDVIMADRGFNISDDLALCGARLVIPAFTRGKSQLSKEEVEKTRQIARVRIHVERVIGQLRKKYKILQNKLPVSLIQCPSDRENANCTIDRILITTAALTNLCSSVVS